METTIKVKSNLEYYKNLQKNIFRIKEIMNPLNEYIDIPYDEKEKTGSTENKPIELIGGIPSID